MISNYRGSTFIVHYTCNVHDVLYVCMQHDGQYGIHTICRLSTINIQEIKPHMFIPPPAVINTFKSRKLQSTIKNISLHACVNTMNCRFALCVLNMMPKSFSAIVIPNVTGYKSKIVIVFLHVSNVQKMSSQYDLVVM